MNGDMTIFLHSGFFFRENHEKNHHDTFGAVVSATKNAHKTWSPKKVVVLLQNFFGKDSANWVGQFDFTTRSQPQFFF